MAEVAQARKRDVRRSVHAERSKLYAETTAPLTINGVHLNSDGNRQIAQVIDATLFGEPPKYDEALLTQAAAGGRRQGLLLVPPLPRDRRLLDLRRPRVPEVRARQPAQRQSRIRWPSVAKEDVLPSNYDVLQRELAILDEMTANRDRRIWAVARGGADLEGRRLRTRRRSSTRKPTCQGASPFKSGDETDRDDDRRPGAEGQAVRLREGVPRAGQAGADGVRHQGPAVGRGAGRPIRTGSRRRR